MKLTNDSLSVTGAKTNALMVVGDRLGYHQKYRSNRENTGQWVASDRWIRREHNGLYYDALTGAIVLGFPFILGVALTMTLSSTSDVCWSIELVRFEVAVK